MSRTDIFVFAQQARIATVTPPSGVVALNFMGNSSLSNTYIICYCLSESYDDSCIRGWVVDITALVTIVFIYSISFYVS